MLPPDCAPSSIPDGAEERREAQDVDGERVYTCVVDGNVVGCRWRAPDGRLLREHGLRDGRWNGWERHWDDEGRLSFESFHINGSEHGVVRQWHEGRLVGWYVMDHGTGLDLWRGPNGELMEERSLKDGGRHGLERWWSGDNVHVWWEQHFHDSREHGIERKWLGDDGRIESDFPRFHIKGLRVSKDEYLHATETDPTLPPYRPEDDSPQRPLPAEYFETLGPDVDGRHREWEP